MESWRYYRGKIPAHYGSPTRSYCLRTGDPCTQNSRKAETTETKEITQLDDSNSRPLSEVESENYFIGCEMGTFSNDLHKPSKTNVHQTVGSKSTICLKKQRFNKMYCVQIVQFH